MSDLNRHIVAFPGSFDPVTLGHIDVVRRTMDLVGGLVVGVLDNPEKNAVFSVEERVALLKSATEGIDGVTVHSFRGLAVDFASDCGARWILRGVRSASDVAYELPMAHSNRHCGSEKIETLFVPTSPEVAFVSSTLVRQIAAAGGELGSFVTPVVEDALRGKFPR
ncbi:MAG: pantetheine-phosphate adenylyltransferase [Planctomycetes bacterium]|nr:pantetheine-phosphate adenylyltransferase [Planctomycetota bacterium]